MHHVIAVLRQAALLLAASERYPEKSLRSERATWPISKKDATRTAQLRKEYAAEIRIARKQGWKVKVSHLLDIATVKLLVPDEDRVGAVELRSSDAPGDYAVIHRSSKPGYKKWQVSFFDDSGAHGDTTRATLTEAVAAARERAYRLTSVQLLR